MRNLAIGIFGVLFSFPYGGCDGPETGGEFPAPAMTQGPSDLGPSGPSSPDPMGGEFTIKYPKASSAFFDTRSVIEVDITFTDVEWARFQAFRTAKKKEYVHCRFTFGTEKFADAACRSKGRPTNWASEPKPQFVVSFDHWEDKGRFLGLRRLNLEADPFSAAPVRDRLGLWLMHQAGLHAARVNHARVLKNGVYYGLYMNLEHIDKEFLEYRFKDPNGNLYSDGYVLETNKAAGDYSHLWALNDLVAAEPLTGDHTSFFVKLESLLDVRTMLRLTAAETVLPTSDNWSNGSANFYYYDDPLTKRFLMLPWDFDTFLTPESPPNANLYAFWGVAGSENAPNKTLQLAYQFPPWKKEFEDTLIALRDGPYRLLPAEVTSVCNQIRPHVAADPNAVGTVAEMDADCQQIKDGIAARITYISSVLGR